CLVGMVPLGTVVRPGRMAPPGMETRLVCLVGMVPLGTVVRPGRMAPPGMETRLVCLVGTVPLATQMRSVPPGTAVRLGPLAMQM
ncbi:hypothetical protein, partial [Nocardiopsis sp. NPDC057823]|uniref:hypothetical protein n=1 Tax=Nocardiopsis sp. NPDC057823 TaxID=3346256 RepID=UPI00366DCBF7